MNDQTVLPPKKEWLWIVPLVVGVPIIWSLLSALATVGPWSLFIAFPAAIFLYYGIFTGVSAVASAILSKKFHRLSLGVRSCENSLPVAVVYLCCDDFQEDCARSLASQRYREFHVFIPMIVSLMMRDRGLTGGAQNILI